MYSKTIYFHSFWFELKGRYFIYDYKHSLTLEISEKMYINLCEIERRKITDFEKFKSYPNIKYMIKRDIVAGLEKYIPEIKYYDLVSLSFAPVYGCNFRCKYCFGEHGDSYKGKTQTFTEKNLRKAIDYFVFELFPEAGCYRLDFVSGGEPLLNFELIRVAIEHIEFIREKYGKRIQIWLCTNGSLLTDEICKYLDKKGISIGVSLDGPKSCHDCNRVDCNGNGTYDLVVRKIKSVLENKELSKRFRHIWTLSVVSDKNKDFVSILKHHMNLGIKSIQMKLVREKKNSQKDDWVYEEYNKLSEFLYSKFVSGEMEYFYALLNQNDYFGKILKRILQGYLYDRRCMAGTRKVAICPDGSIYPCDSFVGDMEMCLGNMFDRDIDLSKFERLRVQDREKCNECKIRYICAGDCYYNSYINTNKIALPEDSFCEIQNYVVRLCVALKIDMERENPNKLKELVRGVNLFDDYNKV